MSRVKFCSGITLLGRRAARTLSVGSVTDEAVARGTFDGTDVRDGHQSLILFVTVVTGASGARYFLCSESLYWGRNASNMRVRPWMPYLTSIFRGSR